MNTLKTKVIRTGCHEHGDSSINSIVHIEEYVIKLDETNSPNIVNPMFNMLKRDWWKKKNTKNQTYLVNNSFHYIYEN